MFPQMSATEDLADMDGTDLLGLLLHSGQDGSTEPLFPDSNELIESWLSEQDVRVTEVKSKVMKEFNLRGKAMTFLYMAL